MKYQIDLTASAEKELDRLDPQTHRRVAAKILLLEDDPRPPRTSRKLETPFEGHRLRIGDWRVLYVVDDETHTISVYAVKHRREAYRRH